MQVALDVTAASEIPVVSQGAGLLGAGYSAWHGDYLGSGLALLGMVPILGSTADGARLLRHGDDLAGVANSGMRALPSPRQALLDAASDPGLRNRIDKMYRANARIGNGSTADAIRHELRTGELLSPSGHMQKGIEMRNGLMKDLRSGRLNEADTKIARDLLKDLQNAISGQ